MKSKEQNLKDLFLEIETKLASGLIKEKPSNATSGCTSCVFNGKCRSNYKMPCMSHNRVNKDSIYYSSK